MSIAFVVKEIYRMGFESSRHAVRHIVNFARPTPRVIGQGLSAARGPVPDCLLGIAQVEPQRMLVYIKHSGGKYKLLSCALARKGLTWSARLLEITDRQHASQA